MYNSFRTHMAGDFREAIYIHLGIPLNVHMYIHVYINKFVPPQGNYGMPQQQQQQYPQQGMGQQMGQQGMPFG
jgi:hypothetical protein